MQSVLQEPDIALWLAEMHKVISVVIAGTARQSTLTAVSRALPPGRTSIKLFFDVLGKSGGQVTYCINAHNIAQHQLVWPVVYLKP